jgi:hypothetical protein
MCVVGVEDFDVLVQLEVAGGDDAGTFDVEVDRGGGLVGLQLEGDLLQVEDNVHHVFFDARNILELVLNALDLHAGDRGALDARQQDAAQGVAQRHAKAALERLGEEFAVVIGERFLLAVKRAGNQQFSQLHRGKPFASGFAPRRSNRRAEGRS